MTLHTALVLSSYFASIPSHGGKGSIRCNMVTSPFEVSACSKDASFWTESAGDSTGYNGGRYDR